MNNIVDELSLEKVKKDVYKLSESSVLSKALIQAITYDSRLVRMECELWDFKKEASTNKSAIAKTVLQILSFHNTYGGYLIYGVEEIEEDLFEPIGVSENSFSRKRLRDTLRSYISELIDVHYEEIEVAIGCWQGRLGILHIPKRKKDTPPLFFGKNGPSNEKGKLVFEKDTTYVRVQDNCEPATKKQHMEILFSDREFSCDNDVTSYTRVDPLYNNLPDRSLICSHFIGRDNIIQELWRWLGDPLSYTKLLAGDGGKGKSSIAYEFSEEICRIKPFNFELVIWITGKKKQFLGLQNRYANIAETHFHDLESLLIVICEFVGILEEEVEGASLNYIKQAIRKSLQILPAFIVIDDVDSLEVDEQRKVMETVMYLSDGESRFLLTTRMNLTYSSDTCITVPGLIPKDYRELLSLYCEQFNISKFNSKQIETLLKITDGSPLFTESILRLMKAGVIFGDAVKEWKGEAGDDVRRAALEREIMTLSPESRRVLYALALMLEASATELKQITGLTIGKFEAAINELYSLFLITSPQIIKTEKRFRVSKNTALLITQNTKLISDPKRIEKNVRNVRASSNGDSESRKYKVGAAINQAFALLKDMRPDEAVKTIDSVLAVYKNNKDLLFVKARCLINTEPPRIDDARTFFRHAYNNGQRRSGFFDCWYSAENLAEDPHGMIEVATLALDSDTSNTYEWRINRAIGYKNISSVYQSSGDIDRAIKSLVKASEDIVVCINTSRYSKRKRAIEFSKIVNEDLWSLLSTTDSSVNKLDVVLSIIENGDLCNVWFYRAGSILRSLVANTDHINIKWYNFIDQSIRRLRELVSERKGYDSSAEMYESITNAVGELSAIASEWKDGVDS